MAFNFHEMDPWSVGGSEPVGRKCKNGKAEIFPQMAENRKAKHMTRPKKN